MKIGERIVAVRRSVGIGQTELAEEVGVSKQTLYKYENNVVVNIPIDKIEQIAKALNVSPSYLVGWEANPDNSEEDRLLAAFRKLNSSDKAEILKYAIFKLKDSKYAKGRGDEGNSRQD